MTTAAKKATATKAKADKPIPAPISVTVEQARKLSTDKVAALAESTRLGKVVQASDRKVEGLAYDAALVTYAATKAGVVGTDAQHKGDLTLAKYGELYGQTHSYVILRRRCGIAAVECGVQPNTPMWSALSSKSHANGSKVGKYLDSKSPSATGLLKVYKSEYDGIGGKKRSASGTKTGEGQKTPAERLGEAVKAMGDDTNVIALTALAVLVKALPQCDRATVAKVEETCATAIASALDGLVKTERQNKAQQNSNRNARTGVTPATAPIRKAPEKVPA